MEKGHTKGFTLIEMIVVIAIIALLIAMVAPSVTHYIATAKSTACAGNRETLRRSLEAQYYMGDITAAQLQSTADGEGIVCPSNGDKYTVTLDGETIVVTCPVHGAGETDTDTGMGKGVERFNLSPALTAALQQVNITTRIDSGAVNGIRTPTILKYFASIGVDLSKSNINSWCVYLSQKATGTTPTQYNYYWSEANLTDGSVKVGDKVTVMRYNTKTGTYTAGQVTVTSYPDAVTGKNYLALCKNGNDFTEYNSAGQSTVDKTNFSNVVSYYEKAKAEYGK